ncbi:MAG TPA: hypothetical protein EYG38_10230, partial [Verrucomicrobia bacterium]|nr:hypothetical protein [Verrucomicrobiota bacterium]
DLFRRIVDFGRELYNTDKATYHVSATLEGVAPSSDISDPHRLEQIYLECWQDVPEGLGFTEPGRQILHCTFGSTLTHEEFGKAIRSVLVTHADTYREVLSDHFARHLKALETGMSS